MTNAVRILRDGAVTTVVLSRPGRRNAVDCETAEQLADAFRAFDSDDEAAVAVLYGDDGVFCAGADLKAFAEGRGNRVEPDGDGPMGPTRLELSKPVIAAIDGYCVAGGLELALWCDLRVATSTSTFGVFCRRFGVPLIDGGTVRLPRLIGHSRAMDLILTGRAVDAEEALSMGLINRLVDGEDVVAAACELGRSIAGFPQACMRADRKSARSQWGLGEQEAMQRELEGGVSVLGEAQAGAARFSAGEGRGGAFPTSSPRDT